MKIIRFDFEKIIYALLEVKNKTASQVINAFFGQVKNELLDQFTKTEETLLYHFGFEINQPMDLVLSSFHYWIKKFNQAFGDNTIDIVKYLRFPASEAFQKRVNAYVEIMRIWIKLDQREVMLELFDIHHPLSIPILKEKNGDKRNSANLSDPGNSDSEDYYLETARLFVKDSIWHYAVYVNEPDQVLKLHNFFKELSNKNSEFMLPFQQLVNNIHDGSLYTKIINKIKCMEIEFVTELP
ncbi:MAG: hypothetical protein Q7U02_07275 [Desulfosalsimonadaceae bacterium]|nr:hypothetical protein [Desulfosalsimonadaceae bacterium]